MNHTTTDKESHPMNIVQLTLTPCAYGDWIANLWDGDDIKASGFAWDKDDAIAMAIKRYRHLYDAEPTIEYTHDH